MSWASFDFLTHFRALKIAAIFEICVLMGSILAHCFHPTIDTQSLLGNNQFTVLRFQRRIITICFVARKGQIPTLAYDYCRSEPV